jgi:uncharacterized membrane protein YkvA (DUF1232 family)
MAFEAPDFAGSLRAFVDGYDGARMRAVRWAPEIFQMYARMFIDGRLSRDARSLVNAALAYFVVPEDLMPESELGPVGLMDDLFVASHVYRLLRRELEPEIIADAWHGDAPIDEVMDEVHGETRAELGKRTREVLRLAGLG